MRIVIHNEDTNEASRQKTVIPPLCIITMKFDETQILSKTAKIKEKTSRKY